MSKENQVPFLRLPKEANDPRLLSLRDVFERKFSRSPSFIIRVPGRVNLIGEHIDYHGFPVLPMAIERDVLLAVAPNDKGVINLTNVKSDTYADYAMPAMKLDVSSPPSWYDYFMCGFRGAVEKHLESNGYRNKGYIDPNQTFGIDVCCDGTVPPSAGLSSSSALVCASALAVLSLLKNSRSPSINKSEIASLSAESERYIGTQGGGMDQAIAFLAEEGRAKLIEFDPVLEAYDVQLPEGANFYISHSGKTLNKAATIHYNTRVFETRVAAAMIIYKATKLSGDYVKSTKQFSSLKDALNVLNMDLKEMIRRLRDYLKPDKLYNVDDIMQELGITSVDGLTALISGSSESAARRFGDVISLANQNGFPLYKRALHVYEEAARVYDVKRICASSMSSEDKLEQIGHLMNLSHLSCKNLYDCSCDELDLMVEKSQNSGSLGARLTGAGWGGCIVALVQDKDKHSYEQCFAKEASFTFCSKPTAGALAYICD